MSVEATGCLKAPHNETGDGFGSSIALSGDGQILVVGAEREDGNGTGFGGDPTDNSAFNAGAVYRY